jgi:hypothetical protein
MEKKNFFCIIKVTEVFVTDRDPHPSRLVRHGGSDPRIWFRIRIKMLRTLSRTLIWTKANTRLK